MGLFDFLSGLFGGGTDETEESRSTAGDGTGHETDEPRSTAGDDTGEDETETKDVTEYGPDDFRQTAEEFAADHEDYNFDFTVESLERLDEYATSQTAFLDTMNEEVDGENPLLGDLRKGYVLWWGSYFGEVLVRQFDAEWVTDEETVSVRVPTANQPIEILALDAAMAAVDGEPQFAETAAGLQSDIEEAEEAANTDAPAVETVLASLELDPSLDLETAHERAVEEFQTAGYQVSQGDIMNSVSERAAEDCTRLFIFYDGPEMHLGVVYQGDWNEHDTNEVFALLSNFRSDEEIAGVHVISAHDLPDAISYLSGTHPRGAFATAAVVAVQTGQPFGASSATHYAEVGQELLADYLDVEIDVADPASLERIDDVVLSELRTVDEHRSQEGYKPKEALLVLGALAGEVMGNGLEWNYPVETEWNQDEKISSTGVVLTVRARESGDEADVNPVGKALKLFENGNEDSIDFMYDTVRGIVEDDLL